MEAQTKDKADVIKEQNLVVPASEEQLRNLNLTSPRDIVKVSKEVAKYVNSSSLSVKIQGKPYVQVEGWQFTAGLLGLICHIEYCKDLSSHKEVEFKWNAKGQNGQIYEKKHKTKHYKYEAKAIFKNPKTDAIVGQAFAMCTNEEKLKHTFEEYAIMSMAQTRAIGKAARVAFAFIIKAAGYEPTPAEEMEGIVNDDEGEIVETILKESLIKKIMSFKTADGLIKWAGSDAMREHHTNPNFRKLVTAKENQIHKEHGTSKNRGGSAKTAQSKKSNPKGTKASTEGKN